MDVLPRMFVGKARREAMGTLTLNEEREDKGRSEEGEGDEESEGKAKEREAVEGGEEKEDGDRDEVVKLSHVALVEGVDLLGIEVE